MQLKQIVARFKDGHLLKGETSDFSPESDHFNINLKNGEFYKSGSTVLKNVPVNLQDLKALFIVKDFDGNEFHKDNYKDSSLWYEKKLKVLFPDGEEIVGYTGHYSLGLHGFFMVPADSRSNNENIFVMQSAAKDVVFL